MEGREGPYGTLMGDEVDEARCAEPEEPADAAEVQMRRSGR